MLEIGLLECKGDPHKTENKQQKVTGHQQGGTGAPGPSGPGPLRERSESCAGGHGWEPGPRSRLAPA